MVEGKDRCSALSVFLFVTSTTHRSVGSETGCDLTGMSVQCGDLASKVLGDQRKVQLVERELSTLRCEMKEFKRAVQKISAPY